jgi:hypothetical protein
MRPALRMDVLQDNEPPVEFRPGSKLRQAILASKDHPPRKGRQNRSAIGGWQIYSMMGIVKPFWV